MPDDEQLDFRDMREGDFSWVQNQLHTMFRPLIGSDAAWLYTVLSWLVPQAEFMRKKGVAMDLSITVMQTCSGLGRGTTYRSLATLVKIGMVRKIASEGRTPLYELVSLRKLAELGVEGLKQRIVVPGGNDAKQDGDLDSGVEPPPNDAQSRANGSDASSRPDNVSVDGRVAPAATGKYVVPPWNDVPKDAKNGELALGAEDEAKDEQEDRSTTEQHRSKTGGVSFPTGTTVILLSQSQSEKDNTPPTPASGGKALVLPNEARPGEAGYDLALGVAARWVMHRHLLTGRVGRGIERTIGEALTLWCGPRGRSLQQAAELAVTNLAEYRRLEGLGLLRVQYGVSNFFRHGKWADQSSWEIDRKQAQAMSEASVGMREPAPAKDPFEDHREFILANAAKIAAAGIAQDVVDSLHRLAASPESISYADLDWELQDLEDKLLQVLEVGAAADELADLYKRADADLAIHRGKMTPEQLEKVRLQYVQKRLIELRGMPRLSLFFMSGQTVRSLKVQTFESLGV